jgi:hypothetical protein
VTDKRTVCLQTPVSRGGERSRNTAATASTCLSTTASSWDYLYYGIHLYAMRSTSHQPQSGTRLLGPGDDKKHDPIQQEREMGGERKEEAQIN